MKKITLAIIQARLTSKRFPGKILKKIGNEIILDKIYYNILKSKKIDNTVVSIPNNKKNLRLKKYLIKKRINFFCGSENDVLSRFFKTAKEFKASTIVRITADCPLVDHKLIDKMLTIFNKSKLDIISNTIYPSFPNGLDVEIFNFNSLNLSNDFAKKNMIESMSHHTCIKIKIF